MSLIISRDIVLTPQVVADGNKPIIGWRNVVTLGNVVADTEAADYPASNLANPLTFSRWRAADTTEQYLTVTTNTTDPLDYIAIARHNLASAAIPVSVEGKLGVGDWFELVEDVLLPNDGPALFRFPLQTLTAIRLRFQAGEAPTEIAVLYAGALLILERKIWVGQTAPNDGLDVTMTNGRSENGEYLGTIELSRRTSIKVPLSLIDPAWYRLNMRDFVTARPRVPFFFAWRPEDFPQEVGFMWLPNIPKPVNEGPSGLIAMSLDLQGIA